MSTTAAPLLRTGPSPLEVAKACLDIPTMAQKLGWDWTPGRSCRAPYRDDRSPSGSVLADGRLFHDFSTGESLDAPALLAAMTGLSRSEACREFIKLAGVKPGDVALPTLLRPAATPLPPPRKPALPKLAAPTGEELSTLGEHRKIPVSALVEANARGVLWAGDWYGGRCWFLSDSSGWSAQARRLDGVHFHRREDATSRFKSWTVAGSRGGWPVGLPDAVTRDRIAIVEGGPDFLACLAWADLCGKLKDVGVVAMLGAGVRIVPEALAQLRGRRIRIFPHVDEPKRGGRRAGYEGAFKWQCQLDEIGVVVDSFDLQGLINPEGREAGDVNGVVRWWDHYAARFPELYGAFDF